VWGVLGLGNPGERYASTRHNVGFMVVDELARRGAGSFRRQREKYWLAEIEYSGEPVLLAKPTTFMNKSGGAAQSFLAAHALDPLHLLVVVDDVYLPFGRMRLRPSGSAGGHNGLLDIEAALQTRDFPRLRLGVGAPEGATGLADHVLGEWTDGEREALPAWMTRAADAVQVVIALGVERARTQVNAAPPASTS